LDLEPGTVEQIARLDVDPAAQVEAIDSLSTVSINTVLRVTLAGGRRVVLKVRAGEGQRVFDREAFQLVRLAEKSALPVPRVLAHRKDGAAGPYTYLILGEVPGVPWGRLQTVAPPGGRAQVERELGILLARLHRENAGPAFAELLPQPSPGYRSWPEFFSSLWRDRILELLRTDRLDPQALDAIQWIHDHLPRFIATRDDPRLIHGNLGPAKLMVEEKDGSWRLSGVLGPLLAHAHREVDLALLELRCGIGPAFFAGYASELPIEDGFERRKKVYKLYSVLDDVRLHGGTHHILSALEIVREIIRESTA
jgi:fructosamine-3-kinase